MESPRKLHRQEVDEPQLPAPAPQIPSSPISSQGSYTSTTSASRAKRPAPSLLPPFEPLSSSPVLPRPAKRQNTGNGFGNASLTATAGRTASAPHLKYPTPVPTSSTGILSSSPPRVSAGGISFDFSRDASVAPQQSRQSRPWLSRTTSERAPLTSVPRIELPENGEPVIMGRSSNSCHYQLSSNRLISRSHVKARFVPAGAEGAGAAANKIEIVCCGWNGIKLHCQGRTWELFKGDSFTSETEAEVMLDVQDARVMIQWPPRSSAGDPLSAASEASWEDSPRLQAAGPNSSLPSSPLRRSIRVHSPESPTAHLSSSQRLQALMPPSPSDNIHIYEDESELPPRREDNDFKMDPNVSMRTEATASFSSDLSEPDENDAELGLDDPDEENDPIVHSFGPFGADISSRMASILSQSPKAALKAKRSAPHASSPGPLSRPRTFLASSPKKTSDHLRPIPSVEAPVADSAVAASAGNSKETTPLPLPMPPVSASIINHTVNQLAFSRLSSTPLSTIMQHLPAEDRDSVTKESLRRAIEAAPAVGIIPRQGKDAAGKALESEYYYVPEEDDDAQRRAAVVDGLRKPSLRNCRKQHKQYYWKRPRTP